MDWKALALAALNNGLKFASAKQIGKRMWVRPPRSLVREFLVRTVDAHASPISEAWEKPTIRPIAKPTVTKFWIEEHNAKRAGLHYDITVQAPDGRYYRWATRDPKWKQFGLRSWFLQPEHYSPTNPAVIEEGYGAGTCKVVEQGRCLVWTDNDHLHMVFEGHRGTFVYLGDDKVVRAHPRNVPVTEKPHFKQVDWEKAENYINDPGYIASVKKDGARGNWRLELDGATGEAKFAVGSYRPDKMLAKSTGHQAQIDWSVKLLDRVKSVEKGLSGAKGRRLAKTLGTKHGKLVIEGAGEVWIDGKFEDLNALLQPDDVKAFSQPRDPWIYMHEIDSVNGQSWADKPYSEKLAVMQQLHDSNPNSPLKIPPYAKTKIGKKTIVALAKREKAADGVVFHNVNEAETPIKAKFRDLHEAVIVDVKPEVDAMGHQRGTAIPVVKYKGKLVPMAGEYSQSAKAAMLKNPDTVVGKRLQFDCTRFTNNGTPFQPIGRQIMED